MNQYLVCSKELFDIVEGKNAKWVIENMRGNGFKVSCIFTLEEIKEILADEIGYRIKLSASQMTKYEYAKMIKGNIFINADGKMDM